MKINRDSKRIFLIYKIRKILEVIDSQNPTEEEIYQSIIDFILVFEYVIKKILYLKNKLLIYEFSLNIEKVDLIIKNKKNSLHTITLNEALLRYIKIFPKSKLTKQKESIEILKVNRNILQHHIDIKNMQSKEELKGVLNNLFPVFLKESEKILGVIEHKKTKKEKTYSEKDIQEIYDNIVLSKIKNFNKNPFSLYEINKENPFNINDIENDIGLFIGNERCPRCSKLTLLKKYQQNFGLLISNFSNENIDFYSCSNCNLELTKLEYDTVQRLKKEGKIIFPFIF